MNLKRKYFYTRDNIPIFCRMDIPSECRAIIVIVHGYKEHSGRYIEFASELVKRDIGVCIVDLRGNGLSGGEKGDIEDFFMFVTDLKGIISKLEWYRKPIITFGHSMGGLITFLYGLKYPRDIAYQIFSAPALGVPMGCADIPETFYQRVGYILPRIKVYHRGHALAVRDKKYLKQFKSDPIANKYATTQFLDQFLRSGVNYAIKNANKYHIKSLFLIAKKDYVIPACRNQALLEKVVEANKTVIYYPKCRHDLLHELNEERQKVITDIIKWLEDNLQK